MASKYGDRTKDKPGQPAMPVSIALNKVLIEQAFKYVLKVILTENRVDPSYLNELNKILTRRPVIYEGGRVKFDNPDNIKTIDTLVDVVWDQAKRVLFREMQSQDFHRGFTKQTADKV
jgi:hypothetical protein